MSARLKLCSGGEAVRKFQKAGWTIDRQKGSHVMLVKANYPDTLCSSTQGTWCWYS